MKLLIFYTDRFGFETSKKGLETVDDLEISEQIENSIVAFIHAEEQDQENENYVETKLVKNLKWAARKNETERIVLHSFNHLSSSSASPEFTKELFNNVEERLSNSNYKTSQTPFGYFLNLDMQAPGNPLARIFKEFLVELSNDTLVLIFVISIVVIALVGIVFAITSKNLEKEVLLIM